MTNNDELRLDPIPPGRRDEARRLLGTGDLTGFLSLVDDERRLELIIGNVEALRSRDGFERALVRAVTFTPENHHDISTPQMMQLFQLCDRSLLRAAGDPLPPGDRFTVYRGVAGREPYRKEQGCSWTALPGIASWFATRFAEDDVWRPEDPAVLRAEVAREEVLVYLRWEEEFLWFPRGWERLPRLPAPTMPGPRLWAARE